MKSNKIKNNELECFKTLKITFTINAIIWDFDALSVFQKDLILFTYEIKYSDDSFVRYIFDYSCSFM